MPSLQELVNRKQFAEAIAQAGPLTPADSADYATMSALAQAYEGMLKYRDAFAIYKHCLSLDSTHVDVLNALARTASNLGRASEAERYFKQVLSSDSTNFYANYQLARLYYQLGNYEQAVEKYEFLLERDEGNPTLLRNVGDCYMRTEDYLAAVSAYSLAFNYNPENANTASALINTLLQAGGDWVKEALSVCDTALYYSPGNRQLRRNQGMALYMNKKYAEADSAYSTLLEEGDSTYLTLKYGGASRYYAGKFLDAVEPLEIAYQMDTTSAEACLLLGSALGKTYDRQRAYALFDQAGRNLQPNPLFITQLQLFRAETLQKDGRRNEAAALYYQVWKGNPKRGNLLSTLYTMYFATDLNLLKDDDTRARNLFIQVLSTREKLKDGDASKGLFYHQRLLNQYYEDAFFRQLTELPMTAPDGKKSAISVVDLRYLLNQIPEQKM